MNADGAGLAQLVEHLICNQGVGGSSPSAGTTVTIGNCGGGCFFILTRHSHICSFVSPALRRRGAGLT